MARKQILVDDLDGGPAHVTVPFALERTSYEIDLSFENAQKLRDALAPFVSVARKAGKVSAPPAPAQRRADAWLSDGSTVSALNTVAQRQQNQEIRAWAAEHGISVAERGRISESVVDAWRAKDPSRLAPQPTLIEPEPEPAPVPKPSAKPGGTKTATRPPAAPAARRGPAKTTPTKRGGTRK